MKRADSLARAVLVSKWGEMLQDTRLVIRHGEKTETIGCKDDVSGAEDIEMIIHHPRAFRRILTLGTLGLGEAYMDRDFELPDGGMERLFAALVRNRLNLKSRLDPIFAFKYGEMLFRNRFMKDAAARIHGHYDIGHDLYESFLDSRMVYTCGYANSPDDDLETMQVNKLDRICRKLRLSEGETVLDMGCGYGAFLIYAAQNYGIRGVGITNSRDHHATARARAAEAGLSDRIEFRYGDYRSIDGKFDKVVTIGLMEHIYESDYPKFVNAHAKNLKRGGLAFIHTIGWGGPKNRHEPFIQKYIFPGTNQPRLAQIVRECEKAGLLVLDVENMARHYHHTVKHWQTRLEANRHRLDPERYNATFFRMWEVYMAWGLAISRYSPGALFQLVLTNDPCMDRPLIRV